MKTSSFDKNKVRKGAWSEEEDGKLQAYIKRYGHWNWTLLPKFAGLSRSGKSCRLRWMNYLRPNIKHGNFTKEEDDTIVHLHNKLGNKWSAIATKLPGRSDNEIKNRWNTQLKKHVLEMAHHGTSIEQTDQANQKDDPKLEQQNEGRSLDSWSCSTHTELSSSRFSGLDFSASSNVASLTSNHELGEDFWTQPPFEDITSSVDSVLSPMNVVDDLITQSSRNDMRMNHDEFSWSMLDSYDEYNNEFINYWDLSDN